MWVKGTVVMIKSIKNWVHLGTLQETYASEQNNLTGSPCCRTACRWHTCLDAKSKEDHTGGSGWSRMVLAKGLTWCSFWLEYELCNYKNNKCGWKSLIAEPPSVWEYTVNKTVSAQGTFFGFMSYVCSVANGTLSFIYIISLLVYRRYTR